MRKIMDTPATHPAPDNNAVRSFDSGKWFDVGSSRLKPVYRPEDRLQAVIGLIKKANHNLKLFFICSRAMTLAR